MPSTEPDAEVRRTVRLGTWRVDITRRAAVRLPLPAARLARAVAAALDAAGAPGPASIGLILSDDEELAELNEAHMGHEGPTDVLSFPLLPPDAFPPHEGRAGDHLEGPVMGGAPAHASVSPDFALPPRTRVHLGDIVISLERAAEQAALGRGGQTGDVRWSEADELLLLVVHGTLHVCGWDHAEPAEEAGMRALELSILGGLTPAR